jgi:hypothetical protein
MESLNSLINGHKYFVSMVILLRPDEKAKIEQLTSITSGYLDSKKDNRKAKIWKE